MRTQHPSDMADALIVVPPLSPSDTNPPLGPYLLRTCFELAGLVLDVCDMSIAYLREFGPSSHSGALPTLGDQDKDRRLIGRAKRRFLEESSLASATPVNVPCCSNPIVGMHYSFQDIEKAVITATSPGHYWASFLERHLFTRHLAPRVLGLSIMGPPQLFIALVVARLAKARWPDTLIVAGGSHVTLLRPEIAQLSRYGGDINAFMPGHCEREFVALCHGLRTGAHWRHSPGVVIAGASEAVSACMKSSNITPLTVQSQPRGHPIELVPTFRPSDLDPFDPRRVTLPMQISRGCLYGRCTMCTYPATEPGFSGYPNWTAVGDAIELLVARHGVHRFSFKDSFMVPKMLGALADLLADRRVGIEWSATTMLNDGLTPQLLGRLGTAGCRTLEFGLETIWPEGQRLFDKLHPAYIVERIINDTTNAGIVANINLIYGLPGESESQALTQLEWILEQQARRPGRVTGSHNMLEINRASPMAIHPEKHGIRLGGIAPWAFSHAWDAPDWRPHFMSRLNKAIDTPKTSASERRLEDSRLLPQVVPRRPLPEVS